MRFEVIAAGIPDLVAPELDAEPGDVVVDREPPEDTSDQPWLEVKYGPSGDEDLHGVAGVQAVAGNRVLDLIVKVNPVHGLGETLVPWICRQYGIDLPTPYGVHHSAREFVATGTREASLYEWSRGVPELRGMLPRFYGALAAGGERAVVVADVGHLDGLDAGGAITSWPTDRIDTALRGIATVHAASAPRMSELLWLPPRPTTSVMAGDADLWRALLEDGTRREPAIVTEETLLLRRALIDSIGDWHPAKDAMPTVLAHNDYNQRNVGFRSDGRLTALDWEIVRQDSPQRDVAELLTFTLDESADLTAVAERAEQHRVALAKQGVEIDRGVYLAGLAADLRSEAINRVALQNLFLAAFPLPYVPRINRVVDHLVRITDPWLV